MKSVLRKYKRAHRVTKILTVANMCVGVVWMLPFWNSQGSVWDFAWVLFASAMGATGLHRWRSEHMHILTMAEIERWLLVMEKAQKDGHDGMVYHAIEQAEAALEKLKHLP